MYKALTLPLLVTLFFHGLLLAVLLIDAPDAKPLIKRAATEYIRAELVTLEKPKAKPAEPKPDRQAEREAEKQRKQELERERQRQQQLQREKQRQLEQQRQAKLEQERQQQALEKQRAREREKARQEQLRKETERELAEAIAQENVQARAQNDQELANNYIALITEVIQNNWSRPPSARNNMEAELALQLVPTGEVVSVKVVRSSGNAAFDRSAETAVLKAERFPELQQLPPRVFEQYFRRLRLKFRPEDLRL